MSVRKKELVSHIGKTSHVKFVSFKLQIFLSIGGKCMYMYMRLILVLLGNFSTFHRTASPLSGVYYYSRIIYRKFVYI